MITMSRCLSYIALSALLTAGAAHAAPADCPEAAGIVAAAYQDASAPDKLGRVRLSGSGDFIALQSGNRSNPFAVTCKAWPAKPELLLAAVPVMRDLSGAKAADGHDGDLDVLVLERATLQPLRKRRLRGLMKDDAVRLTGVVFDTANYDLAQDERAFGIRVTRSASSTGSMQGETSLRLFVMSEHELHVVLDGLLVSRLQGAWENECDSREEKRDVTLSVDAAKSAGYRNLVATDTRVSRVYAPQGAKCVDRVTDKTTARHTLAFDGKTYSIPESLRAPDRRPGN